jgi:hypothetical protein
MSCSMDGIEEESWKTKMEVVTGNLEKWDQ